MKTHIKKISPIFLATFMLLCSMVLCTIFVDFGSTFTPMASAADGNSLKYTKKGNGTCYVSGFSTDATDKAGELIIPEEINGLTVTGISSYAFDGCKELTSVVIPGTVTVIEARAFQNCSKIETIDVPNGLTSLGANAFYNTAFYKNEVNWDGSILYLENYLLSAKKSVSGEVTIKDGTTLMAGAPFSDKANITKVTIPGSLSVINNGAFKNCKALTEVVFLEGVQKIGENAFWNCPNLVKMTLPASLKEIGQDAFGNCYDIEEPHYNGTIDQWASINFNGYYNNPVYWAETLYIDGEKITEVVISTSVINEGAFKNCKTLEKVILTDSVVEIQESAFADNSSLKEIHFGKNVNKVGYLAFQNCQKIEKVTTTMDVNEWSQIDFYDSRSNPISGNLYINGVLLEDAVFSGITEIKPYTFYNCASIKNISSTSTVQVIGEGAFFGTSVENLEIAEGTILIEANAFAYSEALKTAILPSSLVQVDADAFLNSTNINYVNYTGTLSQWVNIAFLSETANPVYYAKDLHINGELLEYAVIDNTEYIYYYSFINCESLKTVCIADGVTIVANSAFFGCSNLESVDLPSTLTTFGNDVFARCNNLKKANYRGTIDEWAMIDFFSEAANPIYYSHCLYLNDVLLENAVIKEAEQIKNYTFVNCDSIKTLIVGGNTKQINIAFNNCQGLTSIDIQESVRNIEIHAFMYCTVLVNLHISEEGESLPLGSSAFYGCSALEKVILPKRVVSLGNSTFKKCTSLKIVYMNKEIRSVGYDAFYDCPALEIVYYESGEEQYAEIIIGSGNESLLSAETHYNVHDIESHYTTITVNATCTEDGSITKSCPCGYSSFTIIHASSHKPIVINKYDATCTHNGYTGDTICEACKEVFEQGVVIEYLGHIGGTATCSQQALCERCSEYYGEIIPHSFTNDTDSICDECGYERELNLPQEPEQNNGQNTEQDNTPNNVQDNIESNAQDNSQNNAQNNVQGNIQSPTQNSADNSKPNNTQKPVEDNKQNVGQDNVIQNDTQNTKISKTTLIITSVAVASGIALSGVYIFKKKRIVTK